MNVHNLNGQKPENQDSYKSLLLLDEISKGEPLSQRDLSKKLNIALGLVNSYVKHLVSKGYITVRNIPSKRFAYYLTPHGFTEKTRLTYHLLQNYTNLYKNARRDFRALFLDLHNNGVRKVAFAGVDELAEIAYLSLQEIDIELVAIADDDEAGSKFFKSTIIPFKELKNSEYNGVIITTLLKRDAVYKTLMQSGLSEDKIHAISYGANSGSI